MPPGLLVWFHMKHMVGRGGVVCPDLVDSPQSAIAGYEMLSQTLCSGTALLFYRVWDGTLHCHHHDSGFHTGFHSPSAALGGHRVLDSRLLHKPSQYLVLPYAEGPALRVLSLLGLGGSYL